jgi:hypothetical protein
MTLIIQQKQLAVSIRVALVIEAGRIRPVWFEETDKPGRNRVHIKEICMTWNHQEGTAKVINFAVSDGTSNYSLSLNTQDFSWRLAVADTSAY